MAWKVNRTETRHLAIALGMIALLPGVAFVTRFLPVSTPFVADSVDQFVPLMCKYERTKMLGIMKQRFAKTNANANIRKRWQEIESDMIADEVEPATAHTILKNARRGLPKSHMPPPAYLPLLATRGVFQKKPVWIVSTAWTPTGASFFYTGTCQGCIPDMKMSKKEMLDVDQYLSFLKIVVVSAQPPYRLIGSS